MKFFSVGFALMFLIASASGAAAATSITWTSRANMPTARAEFGVVAAPGGKVYAIGGRHPFTNILTAAVEAYDPSTNSWATKASLPAPRASHATAMATNGKIYAISGNVQDPSVLEYDPVSNTWTSRANIPTPLDYMGAAGAPNGKVYTIGGLSYSGSQACTGDVQEYNPASDTWTSRASMPTGRCQLGVTTASNGKIYAVGGSTGTGNPTVLATLEEYDPLLNSWTPKASMPTARFGVTLVAAGSSKLYAIGGSNQSGANPTGGNLATVEEYDLITGTWTTTTPLAIARRHLGSAAVNGKIYAIGGNDDVGPFNTNEEGLVSIPSKGKFGSGSCTGAGACDGNKAEIGNNSCNGVGACSGNLKQIGNNSCNFANACQGNNGQVGDRSCSGNAACVLNAAQIGDKSCNNSNACAGSTIRRGDNVCNTPDACKAGAVTTP